MTRRILLFGLLALALLVAAALWWLRGNVDRLVREAIVKQGSALLGAPVTLDAVRLQLTAGTGELQGLVIGNPPGFRTAHALAVQQVRLELDVASLTQPVIVIRRLEIVGPDLIYEHGERQTNFDALVAHANAQLGGGAKPHADAGTEKRLIVERLVVRDAKAQASAPVLAGRTVSVALPPLELREVGRAQGGVTPAQLGQAIVQALRQQLAGALGFDKLRQSAGDALGKARDAVKGLFGK